MAKVETMRSPYIGVVTKYHGPTDTKGTRITARWANKRLILSRDYSVDAEFDHERAARAIVDRDSEDGETYVLRGTRIAQCGDSYYWYISHK